ncbi:MAG: hypothetical protein H6741_18165 [Alphaproteobacteria bacterium]|nr:hypothetical protein [Alphaproteobacteria bacterium]
MADVTVTSDSDYVVVINSGGGSPNGSRFRLKAGSGGSEVEVFSVEDDGIVRFHGRLVYDYAPMVIQNTDSSASEIASFTTGNLQALVIREDGATDISNGELKLMNLLTGSPPNPGDGDVYWYEAGSWYLRARIGGGWKALLAT